MSEGSGTSYPEQVRRELVEVGIRGSLRDRIVAEIRDHLECDPQAELGPPAALAVQFANELGTVRIRRAAFVAFGVLALAGALFVAAGLTAVQGFPHRHPHSALLGGIGVVMAALGAQVALAAGTLTGLRGLRRRAAPTVPRAEAIILLRRATLALLAGVMAMAGLALAAIEYDGGVSRSSTTVAVAMLAAATVALLSATPTVLAATRVRPTAEGAAGDVFDDLGRLVPRPLRGHAWLLAFLVSAVIVVVVTAAGASQADPYDGAARGVADALAFLGCFALLGPYLGLRPARAS